MRLRRQIEAKDTIGALAAQLVQDGSSVMMNGGTTVLAVARSLRQHRDLTIATNNLRVPSEIAPEVFRGLYVFGGSVQLVTQTTTGPIRFHSTSGGSEHPLRCDLAVIGVGGVSVDDGYSTSNLEDATMMRDMMERATRVAVLADSSKFGRRLFAQIADLGRADYVVAETPPPPDLLAALADSGLTVLTPESDRLSPSPSSDR